MALLEDIKGNIAVSFALLLFPILMFVGMAVDLETRENQERHLRSAVDMAVLAAARYSIANPDATQADIETVASMYLDENYSRPDGVSLEEPQLVVSDSQISLTIGGTVPTAMMSIAGFHHLDIGADAAAAFGDRAKLELALVLDNSFSMDGTKMTDLEAAATSLITQLVTDGSDDAKVSIVPFNNFVNVGTSNAGASWLDVPADYSTTTSVCTAVDSAASTAAGCYTENYSCNRDGVTQTCTRWVCPDDAAGNPVSLVYKPCYDSTTNYTWYGCVKSRQHPWDERDEQFGTHLVPARLASNSWACPEPITPLSNDTATLTAALAAMDPEADTYIATGLNWGWRTLSPDAPFTQGQDPATFIAAGGRKALVLMSDGANTRSAESSGGDHWASDVSDANTKTLALCQNIKDDDIEIYTIAFDVTDMALETMLKDCASSTTAFYDADDGVDLEAAFDNIGNQLREISLSK